jgi:hypothetical protein
MDKKWFEWILILLVFATIFGIYLDVWAHINVPELETFFTIWHFIFYTGFLLSFLFFLGNLIVNYFNEKSWKKSLPVGYGLSFIGTIIFFFSGFGDMIWHLIFGIEESIDALLSPTHIGLAIGIGLIATGALRNALKEKIKIIPWTGIFSVMLLLSMFTLFTEFGHPYTELYSSVDGLTEDAKFGESIGTLSIYLQTMILMGVLLFTISRFKTPFLGMTFILTLNAALLSVLHRNFEFIPMAFLTGLIADFYIKYRSIEKIKNFQIFSFSLPIVLFSFYFLSLAITNKIGWNVHMVGGAIFIPGVIGFLMSYLFLRNRLR